MKKLFLLALLNVFLFSCTEGIDNNGEKVVAQAYDEVLYRSEIDERMPALLKGEDSVRFADSYIDNWLRTVVIYHQAKLNIGNQVEEIDKKVEDYRKECYIYAYEQLLLQQKLDTAFKEDQISAVFERSQQDFVLNEPIFKLTMVQLPYDAPKQDALQEMLLSPDEEEFFTLKDYCYQYATKHYFGENWLSYSEIQSLLPYSWSDKNHFDTQNNIIMTDSVFNYYVKVSDYIKQGEQAPYEYAQKEIKKMLLQKRKLELIKSTRKALYDEAYANGDALKN